MNFVVFSGGDYFFLQAYSTVRNLTQSKYTSKQRTSEERSSGYLSLSGNSLDHSKWIFQQD